MKTRTDLLNHLAEKYNLQRYLEIGVQVPELNFDKIKCPYKVGVDPDPAAWATFCMTSDKYFDSLAELKANSYCPNFEIEESILGEFDLIFIDGLHTAEQVKKDFENALKVLSSGGFIVLHDCNPLKEEHTIVPRPTKTGHWNGDVYKFAAALFGYKKNKYTVDIDNGCLVFQNHGAPVQPQPVLTGMEWQYFDANRKELLNLISWDEFINLSSHV